MDHPMELAKQMARLLESDQVAASQIKEHLGEARTYELLRLEPPEELDEPEDDLLGKGDEHLDTLRRVIKNFSKAEVLEALADAK